MNKARSDPLEKTASTMSLRSQRPSADQPFNGRRGRNSRLSSRVSAFSLAVLQSLHSFRAGRVRPEGSVPYDGPVVTQQSACPGIHCGLTELDALNIVPVAICITDLSGVISYRNPEFSTSLVIDDDGTDSVLSVFAASEAEKVRENLLLAQSQVVSSVVVTRQRTPLAGAEVSYSWTFAYIPDRRAVVMTGKPLGRDPMGHLSTKECEDFSNQLLREQLLQDIAGTSTAKSSPVGQNLTFTLRHFADKVHHKAAVAMSEKEREIRSQTRTETMEMKRMFVRHIGHEVRSPLNAALNGLHMLAAQRGALSADLMEILADTEAACRSAVAILDDLLLYEKLDSGSLILDHSLFDVVELARHVVSGLKIQARDSGIALELKVPSGLGAVMVDGDKSRIAQVYRSLVADGLRFTPRLGRVSVALRLSEASDRVRFEVRDGGVGISKQRRVSLFRKPLAFDPSNLHADQGSGLGYFVSRGVVEKHGGVFGVSSDGRGAGSKFFVELSIASISETKIRKAEQASDEVREAVNATSEPLPSKSLRVLVVDDVVSCRKFHKRLLTPYCAEIIEASDGREAVEVVRTILGEGGCLDGIVMDNAMPNLSGTAAAREIRELGFKGKIIGVTGNAFEWEVQEFLSSGANEVMIKPIDQVKYASIAQSIYSP